MWKKAFQKCLLKYILFNILWTVNHVILVDLLANATKLLRKQMKVAPINLLDLHYITGVNVTVKLKLKLMLLGWRSKHIGALETRAILDAKMNTRDVLDMISLTISICLAWRQRKARVKPSILGSIMKGLCNIEMKIAYKFLYETSQSTIITR